MAPSDKGLQSLAVGCASEPPPGTGGIRASQPYTACKLTMPPRNGFLQLGILKHNHEHVPLFTRQKLLDPCQHDMVANSEVIGTIRIYLYSS